MSSNKPWKLFNVPAYGCSVFVFKSKRKLMYAAKILNVDIDRDDFSGICIQGEAPDGETIFLVGWLDGNVSTLVHELAHLALFSLIRAGINPADSNGETMCHLLDSLCTICETDK